MYFGEVAVVFGCHVREFVGDAMVVIFVSVSVGRRVFAVVVIANNIFVLFSFTAIVVLVNLTAVFIVVIFAAVVIVVIVIAISLSSSLLPLATL